MNESVPVSYVLGERNVKGKRKRKDDDDDDDVDYIQKCTWKVIIIIMTV